MKRTLTMWAGMAAAILAAVGSIQAQVPDCNPTAGTKTAPAYVFPYTGAIYSGPTITTPITYVSCPQNGCCDTITVTGIPAGYRLVGRLQPSFVFTTKLVNGQVAYPPTGRLELAPVPVDIVSTGIGQVYSFKVCYPKVHDWPSFETHVDIFLDILAPDATKVAIFGPGGDWDTFCNTVGCTPGKWKNWTGQGPGNQTNLWPVPYTITQKFSTIFGVTPSAPNQNITLLQAVELGGGGERAMIRQCTATLLNAQYTKNQTFWPGTSCQTFDDGTMDPSAVIALVQAAYISGNFTAAANTCSASNESLCLLDGVWANTTTGTLGGKPCNSNP